MPKSDENICEDEVFQMLFKQYSLNIRNYILSKCGNVALAEDIVQDVFMKLWQKCEDIRFGSVKSYIYRAAENKLTDQYRHQKIVLVYRKKSNSNQNIEQSPQYLLEEKEFKIKLENIIASIPEKSRTVFLMNRIEKLTYREIAERLEISQKAVEKRMGIALQILKKEISIKI